MMMMMMMNMVMMMTLKDTRIHTSTQAPCAEAAVHLENYLTGQMVLLQNFLGPVFCMRAHMWDRIAVCLFLSLLSSHILFTT